MTEDDGDGRNGEASKPAGPPRLAPPAGREPGEPLELNPAVPGYDPSKLAPFYGIHGIFAAEPRDRQWASQVESRIGERMLQDLQALFPEAEGLKFECHTRTCKLSWRGPAGVTDKIYRITRVLHLAALRGFGPNALYLVFAGGALDQVADVDGLVAWFMGQRKGGIEALREDSSFLAALGVDPAKFPQD